MTTPIAMTRISKGKHNVQGSKGKYNLSRSKGKYAVRIGVTYVVVDGSTARTTTRPMNRATALGVRNTVFFLIISIPVR